MALRHEKIIEILNSKESSKDLIYFALVQLIVNERMNESQIQFERDVRKERNLPNIFNDSVYRKAIFLYFKYSKGKLGTGLNANTLANKIGHFTNWIGESLEERKIPKYYAFVKNSSEEQIVEYVKGNDKLSREYIPSFRHVFEKFKKNPLKNGFSYDILGVFDEETKKELLELSHKIHEEHAKSHSS